MKTRPLRYRDGDEVELTPVAFELYQLAEQVRLHGLPSPNYSPEAQFWYWDALYAGGGPDYGQDVTPADIAQIFETAAELADHEGL